MGRMRTIQYERVLRGLVVGVVALCVAVILAYPLRAHGDVGAFSEAARRLTLGQVPYVDFFDISTPAAMALNIVPYLLSRVVPMNTITLTHLSMTAVLVAAAALSVRAVRGALPVAGGALPAHDVLGRYVLALVLVVQSLSLLDRPIYSMREHFIALAFVLWVLVRWRRWRGEETGRLPAFLIGVLAGLAAVIKPHFTLMFVVADVYWLVASRRAHPLAAPEMLGVAAVALAHGVYLAANPQIVETYLGVILPLINDGYAAYSYAEPLAIVRGNADVIVPLLIGAAFWLPPLRGTPLAGLARVLSLALIVALAGWVLQQRNFNYHIIPFNLISLMLMGLLAHAAARLHRGMVQVGVVLVVVGSVIYLLLRISAFATHNPVFNSNADFNAAITAHSARGDAVMAIDTLCCPTYPGLQQLERDSAFRHIHSIVIPFAFYGRAAETIYATPEADPPIVRRYIDDFAADLAREQPPLVMIWRGQCAACPAGFSLVRFFETRGLLDVLTEAGYTPIDDAAGFALYVRGTTASAAQG